MAISADAPADREALEAKLGLGYPVVSDVDLAISEAFGVRQEGKDVPVPSAFVLDANRTILWRSVSDGIVDRPTVQAMIERLP